jgi:hypothetical protein
MLSFRRLYRRLVKTALRTLLDWMREYQEVEAASRRNGQDKLPAPLQLYRILGSQIVTLHTLSLYFSSQSEPLSL